MTAQVTPEAAMVLTPKITTSAIGPSGGWPCRIGASTKWSLHDGGQHPGYRHNDDPRAVPEAVRKAKLADASYKHPHHKAERATPDQRLARRRGSSDWSGRAGLPAEHPR